jgi:gamma-glutamyltranspeptidase/glutathione hydrolase
MTPAIKLAKNGIIVSQDFASSLILSKARLRKNGNSNFFKADGSLYEYGDKFKQPDLAWALKQIARNGKKAFYEGKIADKIIALMNQTGGLISSEDLKNYSCVWRTPISGTFKEYTVFSMPPPSSGGIHLIQLLKILERFDLKKMGLNSAEYIHHLSEAMKLVYADRFKYLGDSDFVKIPVSYLLSKDYIDDISRRISLSSRIDTLSLINKNDTEMLNESPETTHYSIVDQWGNAVSNTYTLNFSYGNGIVVPGAGFLLNNQMDDFTVKPGSPNAYGLIGGYSNAIEPEKRMLSSMTPTLVFKNNNVFLVTGTPGGSKIITMVLQQIINTTVFNMNLAEATVMPRFHHQWIPDTVFVETGFSKDTVDKLRLMGHRVILGNASGSMQSIMIGEGMLYGYSDPRKPGAMSVGN